MSGTLSLSLFPGALAVCRLAPDAPLPAWATAGGFHSVTRTPSELSVVCGAELVPDGVTCEGGGRALAVDGKLDFGMVGVLSRLLGPIARGGIGVLAISTYDTDWILVREGDLDRTLAILERSGHPVAESPWKRTP